MKSEILGVLGEKRDRSGPVNFCHRGAAQPEPLPRGPVRPRGADWAGVCCAGRHGR